MLDRERQVDGKNIEEQTEKARLVLKQDRINIAKI